MVSARAVDVRKLAGAGPGDHVVAQLLIAVAHDTELLEGQRPGAAVQAPVDDLERDVAGTARRRVAGGEHETVAGAGEVAGPGLVERQVPDAVIGLLGRDRHLERAAAQSASWREHARRRRQRDSRGPGRLGVRRGEAGHGLVGVEPARVGHHPEPGGPEVVRLPPGVARGCPKAVRYAVMPSIATTLGR